jgi:hypothetical protein
METAIPADLHELKTRLDDWRSKRRYNREPLPADLRQAAIELSRKYPPATVRRFLKLDPWRLRGRKAKEAVRPKPPKTTFFKLPAPIAVPEITSPAPPNSSGYRLLLERSDGARLTITLPSLDLASINSLCADFLRG